MTVDLPPDHLVLVSDQPDSAGRMDPGYVFINVGDAFERDHAATYAHANTARLSFGSAQLGLAHLLAEGGAAYLPQRMVAGHIAAKRLHSLDAPQFQRPIYLTANRKAVANWPWFDDCVSRLQG